MSPRLASPRLASPRLYVRVLAVAGVLSSWTSAACSGGSSGTHQGNLEVIVNGNVAFQSATGFDQSFFSNTNALGPAQVISFSSVPRGNLDVHYTDNFSTFSAPNSVDPLDNAGAPLGSSQEEVVVVARDPIEYRTTLESIGGPDGAIDVGSYLKWATQTFAPGDIWPIVHEPGIALSDPPNGITLPNAVHVPFPNATSLPTTDWAMTQDLFTGSATTPFVGAAASFGGTIKGISVIQRGLCSNVQQFSASSIGAPSLKFELGGLGLDAVLGFSTFMDFAPKGGVVLMLEALTSLPLPIPFPPFFETPTFDRNVTYFFGLDDGILSLSAPNFNLSTQEGFDIYGLGNVLDGKLRVDLPDTLKLAALEGPAGSLLGGQAQPLPSGAPSAPDATGKAISCATGVPLSGGPAQPRPPGCFVACDDADGTIMTRADTWAMSGRFPYIPPENAGDPNAVDPASWHNMDYLRTASASLALSIGVGAAHYPAMTQCGPQNLTNVMIEPLPLDNGNADTSKFHNLRCNFYPQYEEKTVAIPFTVNFVAKPVAELIVRAQRINVFPNSIEAVFVDGPDFDHISPSLFGPANSPCAVTGSVGVANEPTAVFVLLWSLAHGDLPTPPNAGGLNALCSRTAETLMRRKRESGHLPMASSSDRWMWVCAAVWLVACGGRSELDVTEPSAFDSSAPPIDASAWPDACVTPDEVYAVCNGPRGCFPPDARTPDAACVACLTDPNDPSAVGMCYSESSGTPKAAIAADGELYVAPDPRFVSAIGAWVAFPFEVGELFANNGGGSRVRYADYMPWTGAPLPLPETCPTFSSFRICGGNCGICMTDEICSGRSPNHPYGICARGGCGSVVGDGGWHGCSGESCLVFQSSDDGQPLANANGFCFSASACDEAATAYPGGVICHAMP